MKRRTFISLMSVMAAAGVLTLAGCSSNSGSSAAASGAASSAASTGAADQLAAIQTNGKLVGEAVELANALGYDIVWQKR